MSDSAEKTQKTSEHIRTFGSIVTIVTGFVTLVSFVARIDSRVNVLEQRVQTLTVAPTIASTVITKDGPSIQTVPNPVAQSCADLAKRAADEAGRGSVLVAEQMERMMSNLQCGQGAKN